MAKPWLTPKSWLTLALFGAIQQTHEKLERAVKRYDGKKSENNNKLEPRHKSKFPSKKS
jgi:hypothetical protein